MSVAEGSISFANQEVQSNNGDFSGDREWRRLRFEAGHSYRIKFIDSNVEMRHRHYNPAEGKNKGYYRCLQHTGYCPVCQAAANGFGGEGKYKLKKAQETFGANVLVYNTDANGTPLQPLNAEVYFWAFNAQKFVQIRSIQQDWGDITQLDLKLTCADAQAAQFQNVSISNLPQCLYNSDPNFKAQCDAKIAKDKYPLAKMLCKEVDLNGMMTAFGLPSNYLPQGMIQTMPQGQETVSDMVNGTQPMVSEQVVNPQPQMQPQQFQAQPTQQVQYQAPPQQQVQYQAPVQQSVPQQPVYQAPVQQAPVQQAAPVQQPAYQAPVNPQVEQAQQTPDAYADLNELQDLLG